MVHNGNAGKPEVCHGALLTFHLHAILLITLRYETSGQSQSRVLLTELHCTVHKSRFVAEDVEQTRNLNSRRETARRFVLFMTTVTYKQPQKVAIYKCTYCLYALPVKLTFSHFDYE